MYIWVMEVIIVMIPWNSGLDIVAGAGYLDIVLYRRAAVI